METLSQVLTVLLKRMPIEPFLTDEMDCTNVDRSYLSRAVHMYFPNYSDTEVWHMLEGMMENINSYNENYRFDNEEKDLRLSVFEGIFRFADHMLTMLNNKIMCKYETLLRWRKTTTEISEEIFTAAFAAKYDAENGNQRYDFSWPTVIGHNNMQLRTITERGMAENHFHLWGAAPYFHLSWINLMNNLTDPGFIRKLNAVDENVRTGYLTYDKTSSEQPIHVYCRQAALIRLLLFSLLTDTVMDLGENSAENDGHYLEHWRDIQRNYVLRLLREPECFERQIEEVQDYIESLVDPFNERPVDYALLAVHYEAGERSGLYYPLSGERFLYYEMFSRILKHDESLSVAVYNLFYAYLLIKEKVRGEFVQSNTWVGFENFQVYEKRKNLFSTGPVFERLMAKMTVLAPFQQDVISLEARIVPQDTAEDDYQYIHFLDRAVGEEYRNRFYYVFHFIKSSDLAVPDKLYTECRHSYLRALCRRKMYAFLELRRSFPITASRVLGIDAASQEIGCRPEVFGQIFRTLKKHIAEYYDDEGRKCMLPQLRATYHAGEDFLDVTDGLRAIDEAIVFLNLDCGDRLGHALALGISAREWYRVKEYKVSLPAQDYLDNLVWLYHSIIRFKIPGMNNLKSWIEGEFQKYFSEIYEKNMKQQIISGIMRAYGQHDYENNIFFDIHTYYQSWMLRGDNPELYERGFFKGVRPVSLYEEHAVNKKFPSDPNVRKQLKVSILYFFYHYNPDVRLAGSKEVLFKITDEYINAVEQVQKAMQREVAQRGIAIETNPSSNYMIGTFKKYDEHPITVFYNNKLALDQEELLASPQIWVSINTDDIGVFSVSLENEYALLASALEKKRGDNGNLMYKKTMIYEWLDHIREMGIRQSFKGAGEREVKMENSCRN